LEIGIENGFSVKIWLEYFTKALVCGVDILPAPSIADSRLIFEQGDQRDIHFWARFLHQHTEGWDIVIDDGSHKTSGIATSFELLFPTVKSGGYYIIEDLSTAYMAGYQEPEDYNQMEYIFRLVHDMNSQLKYRPAHWEPLSFPSLTVDLGIEWMQLSEELAIIKKK
jgi:cephalosporin hydroxylase